LIDQRPVVLEFVHQQIVEALSYHLRQLGVTFRLGEKVTHVGIDAVRDRVVAELKSGKRVQGDTLIYAVGRQPTWSNDSMENRSSGCHPRREIWTRSRLLRKGSGRNLTTERIEWTRKAREL
jgi:pyruvate/2-oxoglutarate dehydrogenase complex dihydrolipoamide dehydrogenase (E3) component